MIPIHDIADSKKRDIQINQLETLTHYDSSEPHRHNYFEFFYFQKGGGTHTIDFVAFPIESHAIHIVAPGQVHQVKRELDSNGFVFLFDINSFDTHKTIENFLLDHICLDVNEFHPCYHFDPDMQKEVNRIVLKAWREFNSDDSLKNYLVLNQLNELMLYCLRSKSSSATQLDPKNNSVYVDFRRLLNKEFKTLKKVMDYASILSITEKHLNEIVHSKTGETVSALIYKQQILEAKRLLNTGMTAKEVCYELNFSDPGHFSKFFKSQTGLSPSDFRNVHE
jgi:AraC family transcriptional regulator, transcriptional activator of pobA